MLYTDTQESDIYSRLKNLLEKIDHEVGHYCRQKGDFQILANGNEQCDVTEQNI
jgi:hypothetical protein